MCEASPVCGKSLPCLAFRFVFCAFDSAFVFEELLLDSNLLSDEATFDPVTDFVVGTNGSFALEDLADTSVTFESLLIDSTDLLGTIASLPFDDVSALGLLDTITSLPFDDVFALGLLGTTTLLSFDGISVSGLLGTTTLVIYVL